MTDPAHHLTDEERAKAGAMVEHFIHLIESRYGLSAQQASELLHWVANYREQRSKAHQAGIISLIGLLVTAIAAAIWEGVRSLILHGGR